MKIYEKPKLMVLSVSANDALCARVVVRQSIRRDRFVCSLDANNDGKIDDSEMKVK